MESDTEKKIALQICGALNGYYNPEKVVKSLSEGHRTLQQRLTALSLLWLKNAASDTYTYDDRNEASHIIAKKIVDAAGEDAFSDLPLI